MGVRLVQVGALFHKFHRIVRDVATLEGKKVNLQLEGTDIEIDRNVLQIIRFNDPLSKKCCKSWY